MPIGQEGAIYGRMRVAEEREMSNAIGPRWSTGFIALGVAILAFAAGVYLLFQWHWIGTP
jgi:hypothetical protein